MVSFVISIRNKLGIDIIALFSSEYNIFYNIDNSSDLFGGVFRFDNIIVPGEYMLILPIEYFDQGKRRYRDYVENAFLFQVTSDRHHMRVMEPDTYIETYYTSWKFSNEVR